MYDVLRLLGSYLFLVLTAVTVENIVFARATGLSRIITLVDNITSTYVFCSLLTVITVTSGVLYYYAYNLFTMQIERADNSTVCRVLTAILCISVTYILVFIIAIKVMPYEHVGKAVEAMPTATFNCMVVGTILLACDKQMSLLQTVLFSLGSAAGYTLSILYVTEGQRKLQSRDIPAAFKGLPATLLYLAGLAMAIYGLTGRIFTL